MSSQAPPTYHAPDFHHVMGDTITTASLHNEGLDMEQFMMGNSPQTQNTSEVHTTPPQLDPIGNTQFADFTFAYEGIPENGLHVDADMEDISAPYNLSTHLSDHRNSLGSLPAGHRVSVTSMSTVPREGFNGGVGQGNTSVSGGSDEASPTSNRADGALDKYNDELGLHIGGAADGTDLGNRSKDDKNDPHPPWSELKTKAGKERKRLPLACIACRRKKIRCSGEKPACKHCLRSRIPCVYKVTTRKAAPRTDYMAMLDKRLKRMEDRIIKIVPKDEAKTTVGSVTRAQVKPAIPGTIPVKASTSKKRAAEEAFGPGLENWAKTEPTAPTESNMPTWLMNQEAEESGLLLEGAESLPSKEIQEHLSEIFFDNLYGQAYHVLHKPSFMRKLKSGTVPPVLILAVCAASARFSTHPKLNTSPNFLRGEEWASEARDIVMRRYDQPNITILTCLLILGLHEFGTCQGGRSWSLGGMAVRMAYALQLHRDLDYDPLKRRGSAELSFIDREIRRRTMWACFVMDRFNSSGTDRPTFIKEETIKVQLPIKEKLFYLDMPGPTEDLQGGVPHPVSPGVGQISDSRESMGVAAYMVRSIALWGRIINYLNLGGNEEDPHQMWHPESTYTELIKQCEGFTDTLPESLTYSEENLGSHETEGLANQYLFLHITIHQCMLFMNRFAVPGHSGSRPTEDIPKEFVKKAGIRAFDSANRISELLRDAESHFVTAPFTGYCAFLSSTVHIFGVFSKNPAMEAMSKKNLATNVKYLSRMKKYWGMFHFMSENLKEQFRMCADASKRGSTDNVHSSAIFQYGDWFDRYPHGVSHSDFEGPASSTKKEKGDDAVLEQKSDYHTVEEFFHTLSPLPPQARHAKPSKRKAKKTQPGRQEQQQQPQPQQNHHLDSFNTNVQNMSPTPMHLQNPQVAQNYNQLSPTSPVDMYNQPTYSGQEVMLPPHQPGILPQLDRQLVFGAYAGMDPATIGSQTLLDGANWDMQTNGMNGFVTEPSSAWFMPFNMEPPEFGQEDLFNAGPQYGMEGMHINSNGNMESG